jgi:hypothetical protein
VEVFQSLNSDPSGPFGALELGSLSELGSLARKKNAALKKTKIKSGRRRMATFWRFMILKGKG